jgi:phosphoglucosamine mutase
VSRLFGTDGVRGVANVDLTPELALGVAAAAAAELAPDLGRRPLAVVGRDPRPSGELLEAAVVAGLLAAGADVVRLGVVPTPAVAHALTTTLPGPPGAGLPGAGLPVADLGVMISASHNPMPDNGIKLFGPGGTKLGDDVEDRIEAALANSPVRPTGADVGRVVADLAGDADWYVDHLVATVPVRLDGLRVVVDCAHGAASAVAPAAYRRAGADVTVINDDLSGYRINDECGATHLEGLQAAVRAHGAAAGLAHDGDADRCLAVDQTGAVVDGDQILAVLALALHERGELPGPAVAATVMSNLGFHHAMREHGISVAETAVGDRYVLERMRADGLALGGEQSGHLVLARHATTGDGILTGLHLLARIAETQRSMADLASVVRRLPQVLVNVRVADKTKAMAALEPLVADVERGLDGTGRVLVRPSGTEPLVRVMVEAPTEEQARQTADSLAAAIAT